MRNLGDPGQAYDARGALECMRLAQQACQRFRARIAFFEAQQIAAEIGRELARFDLKIAVEILLAHSSLFAGLDRGRGGLLDDGRGNRTHVQQP